MFALNLPSYREDLESRLAMRRGRSGLTFPGAHSSKQKAEEQMSSPDEVTKQQLDLKAEQVSR